MDRVISVARLREPLNSANLDATLGRPDIIHASEMLDLTSDQDKNWASPRSRGAKQFEWERDASMLAVYEEATPKRADINQTTSLASESAQMRM
jgi:hypothetical protein